MSENLNPDRRALAYWLLGICALVYAMIVLGGVTRLTGSGLSMVHWQPVTGVMPPIGDEQWQSAFEAYRHYPEFQRVNPQMDLEGFKSIFWLEYFHRLLGRIIGLVFLLPFVYFLWRGQIDSKHFHKFAILFVVGALQGLMGWVMVKSGLVNEPHVSPFRLTAHLLLALLIYSYALWLALGLLGFGSGERRGPARLSRWVLVVLGITIASGGLVAGLRAGRVYNSFPLMDGQWFPDVLYAQAHWWQNLFADAASVQFNHRILAVTSFCLAWLLSVRTLMAAPTSRARVLALLVAAAASAQVALGISTLLLHVPIPLAASHQGGAVLLWTAVVALARELGGPVTTSKEAISPA